MTRRTGPVLAALAWTAAVVLATVVGMSAVGAIGTGILGAGQQPLTPDQVEQALAAARSAAPAATPGASPAPQIPTPGDPEPVAEVITSPGGTIVARCTAGTAEVVSATPAQGFRLHEEHEGSRVRFRSRDSEVEVRLTCEGTRPVGQVEIDD